MDERQLVVLDTDVLIDHLRGVRTIDALPWNRWAYSILTRMELFSGCDDERVIRDLLRAGVEFDVSRRVAESAGMLRRAARVPAADALIAATALVHGLILVTRNVKRFSVVPGLVVEVPQ